MIFFQSSQQYLVKFNDIEDLNKQLTPLITLP